MPKQLLIYESAVPLSPQKHRDVCVAAIDSYAFARQANAVPLVASEIPFAAREYPVVFAGTEEAMIPTAILGAQQTNAFVDENGAWTGRYVPAFLRRYPFVFSRAEGSDMLTLCIDESYPGLNADGRGERLFDSEGKRTRYLGSVLDFATNYQREFDATRNFVRRLAELEVFEPAQATLSFPDGRSMSLQGFSMVSRAKLRALPDEALLELARSDLLELCHVHLASLANVSQMAAKLNNLGVAGETEASTPSDSEAEALEH